MAKTGSVAVLGFWASPFSMRVQMALNLKSVDYEFIEEDLLNKSERLLEANPVHKKIPVLIHDEKSICESLIIVQYIDDAWTTNAPSILSSDPYDRATARFWAAYIDEKIYPCMREILLADGDEAKKTAGLEELNQILVMLENAFIKCSKSHKFFGGDKIGYLDIGLGSYLDWIKVFEKMGNASLIDESKTPNLFNWAQQFSAVDAVKDVLLDSDKLMEFVKSYPARVRKANK